ncbi:MAG TPA: ABC transporter ATP-binding protein [Gemmatimonadales bacterium]|nr:ABC transporter ATP-binding protein [Gemmatimonadales bacterium]
MIRYESFGKRYGAVVAVEDVTLEVAAGETLAVVGPNGSGKTTTLKALLGLVRPSSGRVLLEGRDASAGDAAVRARLGYLPQRLTFPDRVTGREAMRLFARLRGAAAGEVDRLLQRVGLADAADRHTEGYSGGMRQRLGLAIALLARPAALVLDEPSAALDPTGALLVRDLIRGIRAEGTTVLVSSHDLAEVAALADRVAVFAGGRLRAVGTLTELEQRARVAGIEAVYRRYASQLEAA